METSHEPALIALFEAAADVFATMCSKRRGFTVQPTTFDDDEDSFVQGLGSTPHRTPSKSSHRTELYDPLVTTTTAAVTASTVADPQREDNTVGTRVEDAL